MKCYFIHCNNEAQREVATGLRAFPFPPTEVFNPVCEECIKNTTWAYGPVTRPIQAPSSGSGTVTSNLGCEGSIPSRGSNIQEDLITVGDKTLYGMAGGQLEFVSMRYFSKLVDGKWRGFAMITFTDHDMEACDDETLKDMGRNRYYELEFPV